mmetsp:Transcript_2321/g.3453  ORF Transcript_2321/g.3453 Transcript_2321/m.3453 type:complete len:244 (-) Transcript_2321:905-1636(-)
MDVFSKGFYKTIGQCLRHNFIVVVVLRLIFSYKTITSEATNCEHTHMVLVTTRSNEVSLTEVWILTLFLSLLTQHAELMHWGASASRIFVFKNFNVFSTLTAIGSELTYDSLQMHTLICYYLFHELLGVIKKFFGLRSDSFVIENLGVTTVRITTSQLPSLEERVPIHIRNDILKGYVVNNSDSKLVWCRSRWHSIEINVFLGGLCLIKIKEITIFKTGVVIFSQLIIFLCQVLNKLSLVGSK